MVLALYALRATVSPAGLPAFGLVGAAAGLVYLAGYLAFGATPAERHVDLGFARSALTTARLRPARLTERSPVGGAGSQA